MCDFTLYWIESCKIESCNIVRFTMAFVPVMIVVIHGLPYIIVPIYPTQCTTLLQSFPRFFRAYLSLGREIIWIAYFLI